MLIFGEAAHCDDHNGVFVYREVAGQIAGNVDGALHLGDGAFPDFGVAGGQIDQEVPGEEVGQVGREAHGQFLLKDLVNIDVEVFVGEVEFEEVWCCLFNQGFIVVVPYRQAPGAFKGEVAAGYEIVLQIALKKERPFFNVALDGTPEQLRQVVWLQATAG